MEINQWETPINEWLALAYRRDQIETISWLFNASYGALRRTSSPRGSWSIDHDQGFKCSVLRLRACRRTEWCKYRWKCTKQWYNWWNCIEANMHRLHGVPGMLKFKWWSGHTQHLEHANSNKDLLVRSDLHLGRVTQHSQKSGIPTVIGRLS